MTTTDELRKTLDERGIEYCRHEECEPLCELKEATDVATSWKVGSANFHVIECVDGTIDLWVDNASLEQVASLTRKPKTCKNVHEPPHNTMFWPTPHFKCSECGHTHVSIDYVYYCPNCGRKVVDE